MTSAFHVYGASAEQDFKTDCNLLKNTPVWDTLEIGGTFGGGLTGCGLKEGLLTQLTPSAVENFRTVAPLRS